jgi:hypothetical protein
MLPNTMIRIPASLLVAALLLMAASIVLWRTSKNNEAHHSANTQAATAAPLSNHPEQFLSRQEADRISLAMKSASHPNSYLSSSDLLRIKAHIASQEEPWLSAYQALIQAAQTAIKLKPVGITRRYNGFYKPQQGHIYRTQPPYCGWSQMDGNSPDCRDGQINPKADRTDYQSAITLAKAMTHLGIAYALTEQTIYAQKALELLRHWSLDPSSRMSPEFSPNSWIELSLTMPGLFYGADLIYNDSHWSVADKADFEHWAHQLGRHAMGWSRHNNFENWRVNLIAIIGAYLHDETLLAYAFGRYKELLAHQINPQGQLIFELQRTKSLSYSLFALNAMLQTAAIAQQFELDLYGYQLPDGRGAKLALDYHAPFVQDPTQWPYPQITPISTADSIALYEMAYAHWPNPEYQKAIESWGRPMIESRVLQTITLTHGRSFQLNDHG